ncbi:MAG: hypothetical protein ACXABY_14790, partial [Candidatus Thorarchaeota archaeon]
MKAYVVTNICTGNGIGQNQRTSVLVHTKQGSSVLITNTEELPDLLFNACSHTFEPVDGEVHVTQLIGPSQIDNLRRKHWDELVEDASSRLWALMGQGLHAAIANDGRIEHARRILCDVVVNWDRIDREVQLCVLKDLIDSLGSNNQQGIEATLRLALANGWTLVGTNDHYDEDGEIIRDWKMTSIWSILNADHIDWVHQLNVYAYMRRKLGYEVKHLEVWALIRDWQKREALYGGNPRYPFCPFTRITIPLWSLQQQEEYVYERLIQIDGKPQPCTTYAQAGKNNEKWEKPTVYKVMKKGKKKAHIASHYVGDKREPLLSTAEALAAAAKKGVEIDGK